MASDSLKLLENLGLTEYEAKTLNTLFKLRESQAPIISRTAQVPKTRVYDVLEKLIDKDLIIEIKGRPKLYRAIDAEKAIDLLVLDKKNQLNVLENQATELKDNLLLYNKGDEGGEKVMKVKNKQDFEKILGQELAKAENSITGLTEIEDNHTIIHDALREAKGKNVTIKLLNSRASEKIKEHATVRQFDHGLNAFIIDDKKVVLAISDFKKDKPEYHFTILNDHQPMADALKYYFTSHWKEGKEY